MALFRATLVLLASLWCLASSIRVLESTVKLGDDREGIAINGAHLDPEGKRIKIRDMTICTR